MSDELDVDVFAEAYELTVALRAHIELLTQAGAYGVPRAEAPIARSLSEPPPSLMPQPRVGPDVGGLGGGLGGGAPSDAAGATQAVAQAKVADWLAQAMGSNAGPGASVGRAINAPSTPTSSRVPLEVLTMSPEARKARLMALEQEVRGCQKCGLCAKRTQTVFSRGTGSSGLCFVGEGPGADEDQQGYPFVGPAGQLLDRMIAAMGLSREEVYVCNIVKCRPPENRKPELGEMRACQPYLEEQLELLAPEVIVALGATAVEGLLGISGGITRLRGTWKLYRGKIAVMPTFHPAYLLRAPSAKHAVWEDMKAVLRQMGRPVPERGKKPQ